MTANQIAAESNRITSSHNSEMESLNRESNRINEEHYKRLDAINQEKNDLQRDYQMWEKQYKDRALEIDNRIRSGELDIKRDANAINQLRADNENDWNMRRNEISAFEAANTKQYNDEMARHNKQMEVLDAWGYDIKERTLNQEYKFRDKQLEYQATQWRAENYIRSNELFANVRRDNLNYLLGSEGNAIKWGQLQLDTRTAEQQYTRWGFMNATDTINALANAIKAGKTLFGF